MLTRMLTVALLASLIATPALAKGTFKGTYGTQKFRSKKAVVLCIYTRLISSFFVGGGQGGAKKQKGASASGYGPDPTAAGAVFPIVLTDAGASFGSGRANDPNFPSWGGQADDVTVTLTGYRKGKVSGTVTGTVHPIFGDTGGISLPVNATFSAKCMVN